MNTDIHSHTPQLAVIDSRGLPVRQIAYWRQDAGELIAQAWVNRTVFDPAGRAIAQWDPRLFQDASAPANLSTLHGLSGVELCTRSVDAGWRVNLLGETGAPMQSWDGRGSRRSWEYDDQLRPLAVFEQAAVGEASCTERMVYGVGSQAFADHNQCGQLIRHDDPAGTCHFSEFGLTGALLDQQQHFLQALDSPDWPLPVNERDALLEPGAGAHSAFHFNPLGELLEQTDAQGNRQRFNQTVDGQLRDAWLHLNHAPQAQRLVSGMDYNAQGQIERQAAGNGVISQWDYCTKDGRLVRLHAKRANGEPLQDLNYGYDPVGNILSIEDKALPVRYFANQRIEPINRYGYDSLYQLIEATGWEAGSANKGPSSIEDPQAVANYRQIYRYDAGGNLLELIHHGPQQHGRRLTAAKHSNRCLPERNGLPPTEAEIAAGFDDNGNLQALEPGRILSWDTRNQLHHVSPVERASELNDTERYIYGADGMRQRKVRSTQTSARTVISETRYLPGLEVRNIEGEVLHVITAQAGGATVQVLHWETRVPKHLGNDPYRYSLADHLGSCALELDSEARIISREIYHPYGSTAFSDQGDSSEESYRTLRYSGKERDATGLYYYGFRYYVPWLQRWGSADPAGDIDGLNYYRMVRNNPINLIDHEGLAPKRKGKHDSSDSEGPSGPKKFKTESRVGLFTKVSGGSPRVRNKHIESEGESESEDPDILYRTLRANEPAPEVKGLEPPAGHDKTITAYTHVAHGSRSRKKSPWISASRSLKVAGAWAAEEGLRVVKFSILDTSATTFDLTTESGRQDMLAAHRAKTKESLTEKQAAKALNFAKGSQEVVVKSHVRPSRILEVYEARNIDEAEYIALKGDSSRPEGEKHFKTRARVTYKDVPQKMIRWTKPKPVLLTRTYTRPGS